MSLIVNDCPFCGSESIEIIDRGVGDSWSIEYAVSCLECLAIGPSRIKISAAINQWNKAVSMASIKDALDAATAIADRLPDPEESNQ